MFSKLLGRPHSGLVYAFLFCTAVSLAQTTRNVGPSQPYTTIQSGIDAAMDGDIVLVAPGTYFENIDFKGKSITVTASGGSSVTTIDGNGIGSTVVFQSGEPRSSVLSNFTITHGRPVTTPFGGNPGGGILVQNSQPTILNNVITQNYCQNVYLLGTGALLQGNTVSSSLSGRCSSDYSGGINIVGNLVLPSGQTMPLVVIGNIIENNTTGNYASYDNGGAGILVQGDGYIIQNNIIRNNLTNQGAGGGIYVASGTGLSIVQNLIYGNRAGCGGGAIGSNQGSLGAGTYLFIANNTIVNNSDLGDRHTSDCRRTSEIFTRLYDGGGPTIKFVNNIFYATAGPALDCGMLQGSSPADPIDEAHQSLFDHNLLFDTAGNFFAGNCVDTSSLHGNLVADPQFINFFASNFRLKATSPAIDAGNGSSLQNLQNLSSLTLPNDLDGNPRELDATGKGSPNIDMGAYEFAGLADGVPTRIVLSPSTYSGPAGTILLTATLSSSLGAPVGPVTFFSDGKQIGVANAVGGVATIATVPLTPGPHALLATFAGQGAYPPATSVTVILNLDKYNGTLNLTTPYNSSVVGQPVTFTVTVSEPDGTIPSSITLTNNYATLATLQPDANGRASFTTSALPLGANLISALWVGDDKHAGISSDPLVQNVSTYAVTTTTLACPSSIPAFSAANLAATVTSAYGTPTGSVTIGDFPLYTQPLLNGTASVSYTATTSGLHNFSATFTPTGIYTASAAYCAVFVTSLPATSILTVKPVSAIFGAPVKLSTVVSATIPSRAPVPTGTVTFYNGTANLGASPLANGAATLTLTQLPGGTDNLTCIYSGDSVYAAGSCNTVPVTITRAASKLTLVSSRNSSPALSYVTFTASLTVGGKPAPAGNAITLSWSGQTLTFFTDDNGSVQYTTAFSAPGSYQVTAKFAATSSLAPSSASLNEGISSVPTTVLLSSTPDPAYVGQPITFTATVPVQYLIPPTVATVSFFDQGKLLRTQPVTAMGTAVFTTSSLTLGKHSITATFNPAISAFTASTSLPVSQTIFASHP